MADTQHDSPTVSTAQSTDQQNSVDAGSRDTPCRQLADLLIDEKLITEAQYQEAVVDYQQHGGFVGEILVQKGHVKQEDITSCLVKRCKIPHLSLLDYDIDGEVLQIVPKELCEKYHLLPIDKLGRILTVAMVDPLDDEALATIRQLSPELRIKPILCNWQHFELVYGRTFSGDRVQNKGNSITASSLGLTDVPPPKSQPENDSTGKEATDIPVATEQIEALVEASQEYQKQTRSLSPDSSSEEALKPDEFISALSAGVSNAVQAALNEVTSQLTGLVAGNSDPSAGHPQNAAILSAMEKVLADTQKSQEARDKQMSQIAHATMESLEQTSQLVESLAVTNQNKKDLTGKRSKKERSVATFGHGIDKSGNQAGATPEDVGIYESIRSEQPLEALTFDTFIPGEANTFAFKLGQEIASAPGKKYNPFFLYGPVGTGKTHLVTAIGNAVQANSDLRVGYVSASNFSSHLSEALAANELDQFRQNYCHWDVLVLDDIQFMGGRVEAQEEFFHIFNVLHQQGRQIVIASDKSPDRLGLMEKRLVSRFSSGIVTELQVPEYETRMTILRRLSKQAEISMSDEMLALVAMRVTDDVRKMTGAFQKILAYSDLVGKEITGDLVNEILNHLNGEAAA